MWCHSVAAWVRDKNIVHHKKFPKKKMKLEAQVWLKLINSRLLPCNHDILIRRDRVCLLYFLMTGQKVNVGCLICQKMLPMRKSKSIDMLLFRNMLTQYLRKEVVEKEKEFDIIIPTPLRRTDITSIQLKKENDVAALMVLSEILVVIALCPIFMGCWTYSCRLEGGRLLRRRETIYMSVIRSMTMHSI